MRKNIESYIIESIQVKKDILTSDVTLELIEKVALIIVEAYKSGKKVLLAGNGGSAADAQHIAAELVSKFYKDRPALNAIALTTNTSILTAVGNDYSHEYIFARQIEAYGNSGDIYIAISTSGDSKNIVKSIKIAKEKGLKVIGLTGKKSCKMDSLCDLVIKVPSEKTPKVQEAHIMIGHIVSGLVEEKLF
jgi:D-sedoheptulose 7-phosphate isomerase